MKPVAVITGAAGGIGAGSVRVFAEAGWTVVGVDRREVEVQGAALSLAADICDPDTLDRIFGEIEGRYGRLDALVNNAAIQVCKPVLDTTVEEWDALMQANLKSVFLATRRAHPLLAASRGAIVNVSSIHAVATSRNIAAYAASKGALLAFTRAVALEFGQQSIRVNAVLPGAVDTPMLHAGLMRGQAENAHPPDTRELVRGLGRKHVLGRVGTPEEIARVILFLADSTQSSFITGQSIIVDGGATARLSTE